MPTITNNQATSIQWGLLNQKFGIEIEFTGITANRAIQVIAEKLNGQIDNDYVYDSQDRIWMIKWDGSIRAENDGGQNEFVTPPLYYNDIEIVQEIVRGFKEAGGKVNSSCGIHVHVDGTNHTIEQTKNFIKLFTKYEDVLYRALKVHDDREDEYCLKFKRNHRQFLNYLNNYSNFREMLYKYSQLSFCHPKYTGLNLLKLLHRDSGNGTFEFRLFNSTLHAGEIRAYIVLSLMMSAFALNNQVTRENNIGMTYESLTSFLNMIGINQEQEVMKNVFKHLTKHIQPEQVIQNVS